MAGRGTGFGGVRRLPSGRWQATYSVDRQRYSAGVTFDTRGRARAFLSGVATDLARGTWTPPTSLAKADTVGAYAESWLVSRQLKPRTRSHYRSLLDKFIIPTLGATDLVEITPAIVRVWHAALPADRPTYRTHAYQLLRSILGTAVEDGLIAAQPCRVRGASTTPRAKSIEPASPAQVRIMADHVPAHYRSLILLVAWTGLRFGEAIELRRGDIDTARALVKVRRAVALVDGQRVVGTPKSRAGVRDVTIPPHIVPAIREHMLQHAEQGATGLIFPARSGGHLAPSTVAKVLKPAAEAAGWTGSFHGLRHSALTSAAVAGATTGELMAMAGHTSPSVAMRYQHAAQGRAEVIASRLSAMAEES